jgi:hypothetical protein
MTCLLLLALVVGLGSAGGLAMWQEVRRGAVKPMDLGRQGLMVVYLVREGGVWIVESVGELGSNPNYDVHDPERHAVVFRVSATQHGYRRVWREQWTLEQPTIRDPHSRERRAVARRGLSAAILDGIVPWNAGLAKSDTAAAWYPHRQLFNGIEGDRWLIGAGLAPLVLAAAWLLWKRSGRAGGEGECRACGYSLAGLAAGAVCPECGR